MNLESCLITSEAPNLLVPRGGPQPPAHVSPRGRTGVWSTSTATSQPKVPSPAGSCGKIVPVKEGSRAPSAPQGVNSRVDREGTLWQRLPGSQKPLGKKTREQSQTEQSGALTMGLRVSWGPQGCLILPSKACTHQSCWCHPAGLPSTYLGGEAATGSVPKAEASVKNQSDHLGFPGASGEEEGISWA